MYLVGLLELRGHLRQQLVRSDSNIDCESESRLYLILQSSRYVYRVFSPVTQTHVDEALIDGELLQDGGVLTTYLNESLRTASIPVPVALNHNEVLAFPQSHADRLSSLDSDFLGRDRGCSDDAPPVIGIAGDYGWHKTNVLIALLQKLHGSPTQEC